MKVFISSPFYDLIEDRKKVIIEIDRMKNGKVIAMEKFYASHYPPKEECIRQVMDSDAVVLILGFKYGSIDKDEEISITEIGFPEAFPLALTGGLFALGF